MNGLYYSKTTGGFYNPLFHGDAIPADAEEVPEAEYLSATEGRAVELGPAELVEAVRGTRDALISDVSWRYERHARETRLGLTPTDDIAVLDAYVQALADVPNQSGFPSTINWPVAP